MESLSFHREMFVVTSFGIVLGVRIVHAVVFIKKNGEHFVKISFLELLKILIKIILKMLEKLCLVFFFRSD